MVRAYLPHGANNHNIVSNTNFPPQSSGGDGEPVFDDEDYFIIGLPRDRVEYDLPGDRNAVDFELVL